MPREELYDEQISLPKSPSEDRSDLRQPGPKAVLGILLLFAGVTLVFGIVKISRDVHGPFSARPLSSEEQAKLLLETDGTAQQEALKGIDTDKDSLSDYDELNVFKTSPYLKDSDSDGKDDKEEVSGNTDPNCPEGQNCFREELPGSNSDGVVPKQSDFSSLLAGGKVSATDIDKILNPSPAELRAIMLQSGVTQEQLSAIDDATLLELYKKTIGGVSATNLTAGQGTTGQSTTGTGTGTVDLSKLSNPEQLTNEEIRQILLQSGKISASDLEKVDDETLRAAFLKSVEETKQP